MTAPTMLFALFDKIGGARYFADLKDALAAAQDEADTIKTSVGVWQYVDWWCVVSYVVPRVWCHPDLLAQIRPQAGEQG